MVDNEYGTRNNVVEVKESDFNFLNALEQDIANSKHKADSTGTGSDVSSFPPACFRWSGRLKVNEQFPFMTIFSCACTFLPSFNASFIPPVNLTAS